jgi:hypothetical protein
MRGWRWFTSSVKFSDAPAAALGVAILLMEENDAVSDRLWGN